MQLHYLSTARGVYPHPSVSGHIHRLRQIIGMWLPAEARGIVSAAALCVVCVVCVWGSLPARVPSIDWISIRSFPPSG